MKIAILSRAPRSYSTRRLREACIERGHVAKVLDTLKFSVGIEQGVPELYYSNKVLSSYDAIIPRIGASITFYGTAIVRQFEQVGVYTPNGSHAITISRDKLRSLQVLARHSIGMPQTMFVRRRDDILPAIERLGGAPVIIKLLEGTQGVGVILADSTKVAQAIVETLQSAQINVLLQKFVAESKGTDIRAFVIGGKVIAAMRRTAQGDEFRSNVHRGGLATPIDLPPEYERAAILASQVLNLGVAGVDMLEGEDGPQILEVNSSPGLEGIEGATGIDIAGLIVKHLEEHALWPEVDLTNRLNLDRGYAVAEFFVQADSELAHSTLRKSALKEMDVLVLSIRRGAITLPNPNPDAEILPGDQLLVYGKNRMLKLFVTNKTPVKATSRKNTKRRSQK
ncbi:RimK family alpha-L-glutamate ligase [bacterium]|nr:RimK family alpha-L-glutamate ligase [bacterium]